MVTAAPDAPWTYVAAVGISIVTVPLLLLLALTYLDRRLR